MPVYQYECKKCSHFFEKRLSMADRKQPESEPCPKCGELEVLQHLGGAPIIHSGEGITASGKPHPEFTQLLDRIQKKNHLNVDRYRR